MDKHESPMTKVERNNHSDAPTSRSFSAIDLLAGFDDMRRKSPQPTIDDNFKLVDTMKHTADGMPPAPGQVVDGLKHTADGMPSVPGQDDHMMHASETPNKGSEDRIGSAAWIAKHAKPGEENLGKPPTSGLPADSPDKGTVFDPSSQAYRDHVKSIINNPYAQKMDQVGGQPGSPDWTARENNDYIANLQKNAAPGDATRTTGQIPPYAPETADPVKEHRAQTHFVHNWNKGPVGNLDSPATPKPIVLRGQNEDLTGGKNESHSWF